MNTLIGIGEVLLLTDENLRSFCQHGGEGRTAEDVDLDAYVTQGSQNRKRPIA